MLHVRIYQFMSFGFISLTQLVDASGPTPIFINQVPAYSALSECAEGALSQIVRNMAYGCGDGSVTTSFDCFCVSSSSHFAHQIDTRVANACLDEPEVGQNASAVEVFGKYCQLSTMKSSLSTASSPQETSFTTVPLMSSALTPTSSPPFASPAPSLATPSMTPPPSPPLATASNDTQRHSKKETRVIFIAVGVVVPVVALSLGTMAFVLYCRRRQGERLQEKQDFPELSTEGEIVEADDHKKQEPIHTYASRVPPIEIGGAETRAELASPTSK
ncbi:hypothetical protein DM02DRAFT_419741 [Periconia macrospinosa]|uniref:Extracellular membrane protein CFEM domain-containing protein n=1 Tax=Periconia macrospinosa TaxID=97972 RepID=A0A2V1DN84_9PLEO|nr:hypothetical protein DM02DRAFT_419741 [Periconia macrospinosa]